MLQITPDDFDELVRRGLDAVPQGLLDQLDNVVVLVEPESPPDHPPLLGLYIGVPLTSRGANYAGGSPDTIMIYRNPILRMCHTYDQVVEQVRVTVIHELAHHFGISDERLDELGWA